MRLGIHFLHLFGGVHALSRELTGCAVQLSFQAASAYLTLLQIPGNFNIFHPMFLRAAFNLCKYSALAQIGASFVLASSD